MPTTQKTTTKRTVTRKAVGRKTAASKTDPAKKMSMDSAVSMNRVTLDLRRQMIEKAAYHRAEMRGFQDGDPQVDWLEAEKEVDSFLAQRTKHL